MTQPSVYTRQNPPQPGDLASAGRRFLAEGDSWFTLGTLTLSQGSNVLIELQFKQTNAVMSWAYPGDTLRRMVDGINDRDFDRALWDRTSRRFSSFWEGIILSAGGNDLIEAAQVPPVLNGGPVPIAQRLFLSAAESAPQEGTLDPLRHISQPGWQTLADHLYANFKVLLDRKNRGPSARSPLLLHTYAVPAARPSGAAAWSKGWLYPAMQAYGIPLADMQPVCTELFTRLRRFLLSLDHASGQALSLPKVHVFDSAGLATITPATFGAPGVSGDWVNEIHLTAAGYRKLAAPFGRFIDLTVDGYFGPL